MTNPVKELNDYILELREKAEKERLRVSVMPPKSMLKIVGEIEAELLETIAIRLEIIASSP